MDMRRADFQSLRLQTIIEGSRSVPTAGIPRSGKPRLRNEALDQSDSADQAETLLDLFWTVYSKLRAVVEGHRVVSEIVGRIGMVRAVLVEEIRADGFPATGTIACSTGYCDSHGRGHQADAERGA